MALRNADELISMDILPSQVVAKIVESEESEASEALEATSEDAPITNGQGPWVLAITMGGYGKRIPVAQFRLQNRAGMGLVATKFRKPKDRLAALRVINEGDELMMVTNRGIIIRQATDAISLQSRMATGVRVQRLDEDDAIAAVALVPPSTDSTDSTDDEEEVVEN